MTHKDFIFLVEKMRVAQKCYFHIRTKENLIEAKHLERRVDEALVSLIFQI